MDTTIVTLYLAIAAGITALITPLSFSAGYKPMISSRRDMEQFGFSYAIVVSSSAYLIIGGLYLTALKDKGEITGYGVAGLVATGTLAYMIARAPSAGRKLRIAWLCATAAALWLKLESTMRVGPQTNVDAVQVIALNLAIGIGILALASSVRDARIARKERKKVADSDEPNVAALATEPAGAASLAKE